MTIIHWILSTALAGATAAAQTGPGTSQDTRRFARVDVDELPAHVLFDSPTGRCSATVISKAGHVLTARHCLMRCLVTAKVFEFHRESNEIYVQRLLPEKLGSAQCDIEIAGAIHTVSVTATAPGFLSQIEEKSFRFLDPDRYQALVDQGYTSRGDFAIVQSPALAQKPCRRLIRDLPRAGEFVASAGFPSATTRPDGANSDGESKYRTAGRVMSGIDQNACLQDWMGGVSEDERNRKLKSLREDFEEPGAFVSDLDGVPGASGSGLWNARGQLVGVLTNTYRHAATTGESADEPNQRYCAGSSLSISGARIFELLDQLPVPQGAARWDDVLRCDD